MAVEVDELIVSATVQPEASSASSSGSAGAAPSPAQASASLRDWLARLQNDDDRTRAVGNDA